MKKFFNAENLTTLALIVVGVTVAAIWVVPAVSKWLTKTTS
jgi:hypothetical protein